LGIEANELVVELEKFIFSTISRSQPQRSQDIAIEVTLPVRADEGEDWFDYLEGTGLKHNIILSMFEYCQ
jgi:hypothetical protein